MPPSKASRRVVVVLREYSRALFRIHGRTNNKLVAVAMVMMVYYGGRDVGGARSPRNRDRPRVRAREDRWKKDVDDRPTSWKSLFYEVLYTTIIIIGFQSGSCIRDDNISSRSQLYYDTRSCLLLSLQLLSILLWPCTVCLHHLLRMYVAFVR